MYLIAEVEEQDAGRRGRPARVGAPARQLPGRARAPHGVAAVVAAPAAPSPRCACRLRPQDMRTYTHAPQARGYYKYAISLPTIKFCSSRGATNSILDNREKEEAKDKNSSYNSDSIAVRIIY
ncbi:unnamed protein product [Euphydryas editha]|uniref:Uncharacterized protein n=1 Tax=Euphydryas editha TaxID=104508 RepID=A0AAU9UNL9_EUPED|nr:unnamed protein product [Euphydryas editha]